MLAGDLNLPRAISIAKYLEEIETLKYKLKVKHLAL